MGCNTSKREVDAPTAATSEAPAPAAEPEAAVVTDDHAAAAEPPSDEGGIASEEVKRDRRTERKEAKREMRKSLKEGMTEEELAQHKMNKREKRKLRMSTVDADGVSLVEVEDGEAHLQGVGLCGICGSNAPGEPGEPGDLSLAQYYFGGEMEPRVLDFYAVEIIDMVVTGPEHEPQPAESGSAEAQLFRFTPSPSGELPKGYDAVAPGPRRGLDDFGWLRFALAHEFPGVLIPPIPASAIAADVLNAGPSSSMLSRGATETTPFQHGEAPRALAPLHLKEFVEAILSHPELANSAHTKMFCLGKGSMLQIYREHALDSDGAALSFDRGLDRGMPWSGTTSTAFSAVAPEDDGEGEEGDDAPSHAARSDNDDAPLHEAGKWGADIEAQLEPLRERVVALVSRAKAHRDTADEMNALVSLFSEPPNRSMLDHHSADALAALLFNIDDFLAWLTSMREAFASCESCRVQLEAARLDHSSHAASYQEKKETLKVAKTLDRKLEKGKESEVGNFVSTSLLQFGSVKNSALANTMSGKKEMQRAEMMMVRMEARFRVCADRLFTEVGHFRELAGAKLAAIFVQYFELEQQLNAEREVALNVMLGRLGDRESGDLNPNPLV